MPTGVVAIAASPIGSAVSRSASAMIYPIPTGPISSCNNIPITTASPGGIRMPSSGTRMIAMPNPVSPRT